MQWPRRTQVRVECKHKVKEYHKQRLLDFFGRRKINIFFIVFFFIYTLVLFSLQIKAAAMLAHGHGHGVSFFISSLFVSVILLVTRLEMFHVRTIRFWREYLVSPFFVGGKST